MKNGQKCTGLKAVCAALLPLVLFACAGHGPTPPTVTPPAARPTSPPPPPPPPPLVTKDIASLEADLTHFIPSLIKEARIPGLQIAVIRDGRIAFHQNYGIRNAASADSPVTDDTIFEAASLTKPFFAYYVMKLVDQGFLDLDKPLIQYIPAALVEPGLGHPLSEPGFHRDWFEKITARHVLSHSSGMPHGEAGRPYPLFFEPGTQFKYSADGYFFLQKIIEYLKNEKLENLIQKEVLDPLGMTRSCLVWKPEYEKTAANGHDLLGKPQEFRRYTESHSAASLYTTAEDYAKFVAAVLAGRDLRPETFKTMLSPQIEASKENGIAWSLGFSLQTDANGLAFWQWGDYNIFRNYIIAYPESKNAVVFLTNSNNGLSVCPALVGRVLGGLATGSDLVGYRHYDSAYYQAVWDLRDNGLRAAEALPKRIREHPDDLSGETVNALAETFLEAGDAPMAVAIREANVETRPESGAARVELAKSCAAIRDHARARREFEKARSATEEKVEAKVIDWFIESLDVLEKPPAVPAERLQKIAGDYGPRHLIYKDGRLYYRRDGGDYPPEGRPLTALSPDTFFMDTMLYFRIKIQFDEAGDPVKIIGLYNDGTAPDESPRTK